eukprot:1137847-Pelagomonas_calceolata.AAC.8
MEYEEGDWIYTQGAAADAVFIPLEGVVSVWAKPVRSDAKDGPNDGACGMVCTVFIPPGSVVSVWTKPVRSDT